MAFILRPMTKAPVWYTQRTYFICSIMGFIRDELSYERSIYSYQQTNKGCATWILQQNGVCDFSKLYRFKVYNYSPLILWAVNGVYDTLIVSLHVVWGD